MRFISTIVTLLIGRFTMAQNIRPMAVAGQFYPADKKELAREVKGYLDKHISSLEGGSVVQAVIVPHAGYVFSGDVAAAAFRQIPENARYEHIFMLGPSHHVGFGGASVCNAFAFYQTPLGKVKVDTVLADKLIAENEIFTYKSSAHDREHCLEVELPILQERLDTVAPIIPIIIGTQNIHSLKKVAEALKPYFHAGNLFVISSDFSHYPSYLDAEMIDKRTGDALSTGQLDQFLAVLRQNDDQMIPNLATSACGQCAIEVLLMMMQDDKDVEFHHLMYQNSGDSPYGEKDGVVGYHAFMLSRSVRSKSEGKTGFYFTPEDKVQLLRLARNSISPVSRQKEVFPTPVFRQRLGAFVTLTENGRLRGCIGHFGEDYTLGNNISEMAKAAAFEDPRFPKVTESELDDIEIEISVLTPLKRINSIDEFDYGHQGIYMRKGWHSGTFLPQVADEVNWTKEEFLGHCAQDKAGIGWNGWRNAELYTYKTIIFRE